MTQPLVVRRGELVIDLVNYRVLLDQQPVMLSYREYALLVYLATHPGYVVTKRRLLEEGMGRHDLGGLRMVDEHIRHLKSKLEREGRPLMRKSKGLATALCLMVKRQEQSIVHSSWPKQKTQDDY
jgi:DNA-binding response OmpR family regulator